MGLLDPIMSMLSGGRVNLEKRFIRQRQSISGTMCEFYKARDRRTDRIVGLKILDPEKTRLFEARFKGLGKPSEGQIAMEFVHPRIIQTYEYGVSTDGRQFLVMEYLEGADMNSLLIAKDRSMDSHRLQLIVQAAEAIAHVHACGFLHRDICPRNLFVSPDGESLKLIDFGLTIPATPPFMAPGNRTGTVNYMAPELVRRQPTDHRVDIFSLGVTAYEIATGQLPWERGDSGLAALSHNKPPTDIRQYRPTIHPIVANAIHACIEPNVQKRCDSVETFLGRLRAAKTIDEA